MHDVAVASRLKIMLMKPMKLKGADDKVNVPQLAMAGGRAAKRASETKKRDKFVSKRKLS